MANIMNLLKPTAKLPRNGFDLSQRHLYATSAGRLTPALCVDCVPGDHIEINLVDLVRTQDIHTDAFVRMKQYFEFYFVPYSQLYTPFEQFLSGRRDNSRSLFEYITSDLSNLPFINLEWMLSQLYSRYTDDSAITDPWLSPLEVIRVLDMLGYGNYFDVFYEVVMGSITSESAFLQRCRELHGDLTNRNVNPFRLLAYNKIWYDYYRNSVYDNAMTFDIGDIDYTYSFNCDDLANRSTKNFSMRDNILLQTMPLRCNWRPLKKDVYTGLYPDTQFGAISTVSPIGSFDIYATAYSGNMSNNLLKAIDTTGKVELGNSGANVRDSKFTSNLQISVLDLLKAEALQKWRQSTMLAGNRVKDQMIAHYGVEPRFVQDTRCKFVAAFDGYVTFDEVVGTGTDNLGDVGAKGIGTCNGRVVFDTKDFGVLMCLHSIIPSTEYNSLGVDKQNTMLERYDFYTPEFQHIGLQPVIGSELDSRLNTKVIGYAPRDYCYKTAVDKCHGQFVDSLGFTGSLAHFAAPRKQVYYYYSSTDATTFRINSLYMFPDLLNTVFVKTYEYQRGLQDLFDQFIVNASFDIKAIRNMSVLGLPQF